MPSTTWFPVSRIKLRSKRGPNCADAIVSATMVMEKTTPATVLIKKAAGVGKGSPKPHTDKIGRLTRKQAEEIAQIKMPDLTAADMDAAVRTIAGSAHSMGVEVEGV